MVERMALFLKDLELKRIVRIFFKNGQLTLELILYKCNISITYGLVNEELSSQIIVFTTIIGGDAGLMFSWFSAGASLVAPPLLISTLLLPGFVQQIINERDYQKFKKLVNRMLEDKEL